MVLGKLLRSMKKPHSKLFSFSTAFVIRVPLYVPDARPLGLKGAAFAALGDKPEGLAGAWLPLVARDEGVKLGESILNRFLMLRVAA